MERYRAVASAVDYDDSRYEIGEEFDADPEHMAQLLELGIVELADATARPGGEGTDDGGGGAPSGGSPSSGGGPSRTRDELVREGVDALVAEADARREKGEEPLEEHWTKSGKPDVGALRVRTGLRDLSAQERDAAWAAALEDEGAE